MSGLFRSGCVEAHEVNRVRAMLTLYVADVLASAPRREQQAKGDSIHGA